MSWLKRIFIFIGICVFFIIFLSWPQWYFVNAVINAKLLLEKNRFPEAIKIYINLARSRYFQNRLESKTFLEDNIAFYRDFASAARKYADMAYEKMEYTTAVSNYEIYLICCQEEEKLTGKKIDTLEGKMRLARVLALTGQPEKALKILPAEGKKEIDFYRQQYTYLSSGIKIYNLAKTYKEKKQWQQSAELLMQAGDMINKAIGDDKELIIYYQPFLRKIDQETEELHKIIARKAGQGDGIW